MDEIVLPDDEAASTYLFIRYLFWDSSIDHVLLICDFAGLARWLPHPNVLVMASFRAML